MNLQKNLRKVKTKKNRSAVQIIMYMKQIIHDYSVCRKDSDSIGGWVAILVKREIQFILLKSTQTNNIPILKPGKIQDNLKYIDR